MESEFKPMICPVCGKYEFVDDTDLEKTDPEYEGYSGDRCSYCGWIYDLNQTLNPDSTEGENILSLNAHREWYKQTIRDNPDYVFNDDSYEPEPHLCPVCHNYQFSDTYSYETCPYCGWIDDGIMETEPDMWAGNANDLCLNDYIIRYRMLCDIIVDYMYSKDMFGE